MYRVNKLKLSAFIYPLANCSIDYVTQSQDATLVKTLTYFTRVGKVAKP